MPSTSKNNGFFISQKSKDIDEDIFTDEDNEIFERWNQSEFADIFLKLLNKKMSLRKASLETSKVFDDHLVSLGNLHLLKIPSSTKNYRLQPSLGDFKNKKNISKLLETTLHLEGKELGLLTSSLKEMKSFSTKI